MATSKTITQLYQNQNNATSPVAVNVSVEPMVQDGRLVVSYRNLNPGVFSPGTVNDASVSNPSNDTNS